MAGQRITAEELDGLTRAFADRYVGLVGRVAILPLRAREVLDGIRREERREQRSLAVEGEHETGRAGRLCEPIAQARRQAIEALVGRILGEGLERPRLERFARALGIESVIGGATPEAKLAFVTEAQARGLTVATGEGVLLLARVQDARGAEEPADVWAARRGLRPGMPLTEGA